MSQATQRRGYCHCGFPLRSFENNAGTTTYFCTACDKNNWNRGR